MLQHESSVSASVRQAIDRSVSHDEIVTVPYSVDAATDLLALCDGDADGDTDDGEEFWGTTNTGQFWRVHLRGVVVACPSVIP